MNSRPKTVKILHATYIIEYVNAEDPDLKDNLGVCLSEKLVIKIKKSMKKQLMKSILWHEILHAIWWWLDLQENDEEERFVSKAATGSYHVLLDNPDLVKYLFE